MDITPRHESIADLFGPARIFRVPKFQRHYAWTSEQIDDLLADLDRGVRARRVDKDQPHFFGGLVTVRKPHTGSATKLEVIDGQQRLATFVVLVAQLIRTMSALAETLDANAELRQFLFDRVSTLRKQFLRLDDTVALKVEDVARLGLSKPDHLFFIQLIDGHDPHDSDRESHRLLKSAYTAIGKYLTGLVTAEPLAEGKVTQLAYVAKVLEADWTVIHMETTKVSYAYNLFQVLNDRGVGLSEGELLRARTLELLDGVAATQDQMDRVEAAWDDILSETPGRLEDALRWAFASQKGYRPGKTSLYDEFLEHLAPAAVQLTSSSAHLLVSAIEDLKKDFQKISLMLDGQWPYQINNSVSAWDRDRLGLLLRELKHTNCMPLLVAATALSQKTFSEVVQLLERFVFRYRLVSNAHIGPATTVYNQQALAIRVNAAAYKVSSLRSQLSGLLATHASDSRFATNLGELEYSTLASNKALKYFLMTVEHYSRWYEEGAKGSPACKDKSRVLDFANTTLEHIHPQNSAPGAVPLHGLVNSLGNLTILGPSDNNAAGNKPFLEKQPILAASNISLNNKISFVADWDEVAIDAWREELKAMALKIFVV